MSSTVWIIVAGALAALAGIVAFTSVAVLCLWKCLTGRVARPATGWRRVGRTITGLFAAYGAVLGAGYLMSTPWSDESRWTNKAALSAAAKNKISMPEHTGGIVESLAARLGPNGTFVALAISGGGSRAAYFAAGVLERLSKVRWPGQTGPAASLVEHVDLISSVSGGSVAAAYFALHRPAARDVTEDSLATFFAGFKRAMATNLEVSALSELVDPRQTIAMLTLRRPMAEAIADSLDQLIGGGRDVDMAALNERSRSGDGPILLLNATMLDSADPFLFADDPTDRPIFVTVPRAGAPSLARGTERRRSIATFGKGFGDIGRYRVADAVAASAAFPVLLGSISLGRAGAGAATTRLGDGGLVDNLGLLTLYSVLLDPELYRRTRGRLNRILVISIDSENNRIQTGLFAGIYGLDTWSEEALHRFVVPAMIDRARLRELGDELDTPDWKSKPFPLPSPLFVSYGSCNGPDVATRFRLLPGEREAIDAAARSCLPDLGLRRIERTLQSPAKAPDPIYEGHMTAVDITGLNDLYRMAEQQYIWFQYRKKAASYEELTRERPWWSPSSAGDRFRMPPQPVAPLDPGRLDRDEFDFSVDLRGDGGAILRATPSRHAEHARVSLYLDLDPATLMIDHLEFCDAVLDRVHGADKGGGVAGPDDPVFVADQYESVRPPSCM